MKVFRIDSFADKTLSGVLMADSSVRVDGRPLFLPGGKMLFEVRPALRINRLGKAIDARFANRYYSELLLVNYMKPADPQSSFTADTVDDAVVTGTVMPFDAFPRNAVDADGEQYNVEASSAEVDELISLISADTTLKTGDLIILPHVVCRITPKINDEVAFFAAENHQKLLQFKIK